MVGNTISLYRKAYSGLSPEMWWLAVVMLINRSGTMVIPFLTVYLTQSGYTLAQAGYAMGAFGLGAIVGSYIGGILTDRFGHFYVQVSSLFLSGALFIVLGQLHNLASIVICIFFITAIGDAFRPANAAAIAAYSNEKNRTRSYSLNRLAMNLGFAVGPAIGGMLASHSYELLFYADGFTCMSAAIILYFLFRKNTVKPVVKFQNSEKRKNGHSAYRDQSFLIGMAFLFMVGLCFFQVFSILPVYYKEVIKMDEAAIGWILAMNGLIIAFIEMVLVYKLENRRNPITYMVLGAFLIGIAFMTLNIYPALSIALLSMVFITFGEMFLFPFMNNFWVERSNESNRGQYAALYTMSFLASIVMAPTLASQLASRWGYKFLWSFDFLLCIFAAIGFYFLKKRLAKHEPIQEIHPDPVVGP